MRSIFKKISNNLDLTFFYLFILSIPLGTKLVFLSKDSYFTGAFVHYTTFFLYLSDIFFILALFFWILKKVKNRRKRNVDVSPFNFLSSFLKGVMPACIALPDGNNSYVSRRSNAGRGIFPSVQSLKTLSKQNIIYYILFFFLICAVLSIFSAKNNLIGIYQVLKLFEFVLLFILCGKLINSLKKLYFCFILILSTGFTQAIISVAQYWKQSNLDLKWLGEPILSPNLAGVAKIVVDGEKIIRAYGTFPHPNILAGFLLMSLFISFYFLLFHINTNIRRRHIDVSPSVIPAKAEIQYLSHFKYFITQNWRFLLLIILISIQFLAFILTFSRTAWLAGLFSFLCFIILYKIVSRETILFFRLFKAKFTFLITIILIISCFLIMLSPQISTRFEINKNDQAISDRFLFNSFVFKMIKKSPFLGIGMGNFVLNINDFTGRNVLQYVPTNLKSWQYQPVHNFYLLITAEIGIIGLILFIFFIFKVLKMAYLKASPALLNKPLSSIKKNNDALFSHNDLQSIKQKDWARSQIVSRETIFTQHISLCTAFILSIFLGFLFIGFFDHYFWTIQQGQLTFWLVARLLVASCRIKK